MSPIAGKDITGNRRLAPTGLLLGNAVCWQHFGSCSCPPLDPFSDRCATKTCGAPGTIIVTCPGSVARDRQRRSSSVQVICLRSVPVYFGDFYNTTAFRCVFLWFRRSMGVQYTHRTRIVVWAIATLTFMHHTLGLHQLSQGCSRENSPLLMYVCLRSNQDDTEV